MRRCFDGLVNGSRGAHPRLLQAYGGYDAANAYYYYFFQLLCCHSSVFGMRAAMMLACTGTASCSCARLQGGAQARVMGALAARMHGQEIEGVVKRGLEVGEVC
jgi:hypothetical protein